MPSFPSLPRSLVTLALVPAALALSACSTMYPQPRVDMQPAPVVKMPEPIPASANNGAIYQNANYRPLFEELCRQKAIFDAAEAAARPPEPAFRRATASR